MRAPRADRFGHRSQLLAVMDRMIGLSAHAHRARDVGQMTLFGSAMSVSADASMISPLPDIEEAPHREMLSWEKELAGVYLSEHPLTRVMADLQNTVTALCGQITEDMGGQKVVVAGVVTYVRKLTTKKGDPMAFAGLEDLSGLTEIVIFPRVWQESQALWLPDKVLVVRGRVDAQGKQPKVLAEAVMDKFVQTQPADEHPYAASSRPPVVARETVQNQAAPRQAPDIEYAPDAPEEPPWDMGRETGSVERPSNLQSPVSNTQPPHEASRSSGVQPPISNTHSSSRLVLITFRRGTDEQHDLARLRAVHQLLTDYPGDDRFSFVLVGGSNGKTQLDFPNDSTTYSADLKARLERLLGAGCVRVIDGTV
jgi:DNA polymerase-3 subunit alpha